MTPSPREIDGMVEKHIFGREQEYYCKNRGVYYRASKRGGFTSDIRKAKRFTEDDVNRYRPHVAALEVIPIEPSPRSTEIAAAMEAVGHLKGFTFSLSRNDDGEWWCYFREINHDYEREKPDAEGDARASTAEIAICLAALKVKGITI